MSQKYVIGLTGNIATGKSIVRRMLQELGASSIDADSLVHLLQKPGTPVYRDIVEMFGAFILNKDATINRKRLGDIVFNVPEAMAALEKITHPAVREKIKRAIKKAPTPVVVIEAIKLLEGGLADHCDAVWVVTAPEDVQMVRLMTRRKLSGEDALRRIRAQAAQADKIARADVVIDNGGDLIGTWNSVQKQFKQLPGAVIAPAVAPAEEKHPPGQRAIVVRRARRTDLKQMAALINASSGGALDYDEAQMMERLFSKGYLLALHGKELIGLVGWQTENLVAGIDDFFVKENKYWPIIGKILMDYIEEAVAELSCEAGLVFLHKKAAAAAKKMLKDRGYITKKPKEMVKAWREAAEDWQAEDTILLVKQYLDRPIMTPL